MIMKRIRQEYLLMMYIFAGMVHSKIQVGRNLRRRGELGQPSAQSKLVMKSDHSEKITWI